MNFGSIIGFIAIMLISSLFNKKAVKPPVKPSRTTPPGRPTSNVPNTNKSRRTTFTGGLEDLFNDFKVEFDKNIRDTEKKQSYSTAMQNTLDIDDVEVNHNEHNSLSSRLKDNSRPDKDIIYDGEIGKEDIVIEFDNKSIVQGIIMSEILQKPKSLRR